MPIEFTCQVCKQQIRVPEGNEGKRTKCPHCSAIQPIPGGPVPGGSSFSDPKPSGGSPFSDSSFGGGREAPNPFSESPAAPQTDESNPYASPYTTSAAASRPMGFNEAQGKLAVPATVCMVFAGIVLALIILGFVFNIAMIAVGGGKNGPDIVVNMLFSGVALLFNIGCLYTLYNGSQLENYSQAWAGFILAMLPCTTSLCCIFVFPFAIWGMVVLSDAEVKRQFRS